MTCTEDNQSFTTFAISEMHSVWTHTVAAHESDARCYSLRLCRNCNTIQNFHETMPQSDKLLLRGVRLFGRHGVHRAERTLGQLFRVDVEVQASLTKACNTDDFRDTLDYVHIFNLVKCVVEGPPKHLVESVAQDIVNRIFDNLPMVQAVKVRVEKPHVAIPGVLDGIGVEIFRER